MTLVLLVDSNNLIQMQTFNIVFLKTTNTLLVHLYDSNRRFTSLSNNIIYQSSTAFEIHCMSYKPQILTDVYSRLLLDTIS